MKLREALALQNALAALDIVDPKTGIAVYSFKGVTRAALARKLRLLGDVAKDYAKARKGVEAEMGVKPDTREKNPELHAKFDAALGELLDAETEIDLGAKLRLAELLREDVDHPLGNQIPSAILIALGPILVDPL